MMVPSKTVDISTRQCLRYIIVSAGSFTVFYLTSFLFVIFQYFIWYVIRVYKMELFSFNGVARFVMQSLSQRFVYKRMKAFCQHGQLVCWPLETRLVETHYLRCREMNGGLRMHCTSFSLCPFVFLTLYNMETPVRNRRGMIKAK